MGWHEGELGHGPAFRFRDPERSPRRRGPPPARAGRLITAPSSTRTISVARLRSLRRRSDGGPSRRSSVSSSTAAMARLESTPARPIVSRCCSEGRTAAEGTDGTCLRKSYSLPAQIGVVATCREFIALRIYSSAATKSRRPLIPPLPSNKRFGTASEAGGSSLQRRDIETSLPKQE